MQQQSSVSQVSPRVAALKARHKELSIRIENEQSRASAQDWEILKLKREKLKIKEEIEGVRDAS